MVCIEHGNMTKVMIMNVNKLMQLNFYDNDSGAQFKELQYFSHTLLRNSNNEITDMTVIKGGQALAQVNKKNNNLIIMKICSYSEQYSENDQNCVPCNKGEYSTLNDKCISCSAKQISTKNSELNHLCENQH